MVPVSLFPKWPFLNSQLRCIPLQTRSEHFIITVLSIAITDLSYRLLCISNAVHSSYNMDIARPTTYRIDIRLLIIDI